MNSPPRETGLRRILTLPLLIFYGVGVTVGAGIFTLIAEITRLAGDHAHFSFIVAGIIAAFSSGLYALLASAYPRAAGEAILSNTDLVSKPVILLVTALLRLR